MAWGCTARFDRAGVALFAPGELWRGLERRGITKGPVASVVHRRNPLCCKGKKWRAREESNPQPPDP